MPEYQLFLRPSIGGQAETIQFNAKDAVNALELARRYSSERSAELWHDGKRLCRLKYSEHAGGWTTGQRA